MIFRALIFPYDAEGEIVYRWLIFRILSCSCEVIMMAYVDATS